MPNAIKATWLVILSTVPAVAYAQAIPAWLVFAAVSPVAVLFLTIVLGLVSRSWRTGLLHAGLVAVWVLLFILVSNIFTNDYVIWTPLVIFAAHSVVIMVLIAVHLVRRPERKKN